MALEWNDLSVLMAVCRTGSLSGAARELGVNHSTVFRKVNAIEAKTGVRFFDRLPGGYRMTEAGETALAYAERVEAEFHALGREILGQDLRLQGNVMITAPQGMEATMLPGWMAEFRRLHPGISVRIAGGSAAVDLQRREADVAIRATRRPPDTSLGRRISDFRFTVYAAPEYLQGRDGLPLAEHDWCLLGGIVEWLVPWIWRSKEQGERRVVFTSSSTGAILDATAEGMGATLMPCYMGDRDERLVRVIAPHEPLTLELWLLTHADLRHTARVEALMAFLYDKLRAHEALFAGRAGRGAENDK